MRTKKAKRVKENYDFVRGTFFFSRRKIIIAHKYNYGNMHIYKFALCSLTLLKLSNSLSLSSSSSSSSSSKLYPDVFSRLGDLVPSSSDFSSRFFVGLFGERPLFLRFE
jgi:hypothetical protein